MERPTKAINVIGIFEYLKIVVVQCHHSLVYTENSIGD